MSYDHLTRFSVWYTTRYTVTPRSDLRSLTYSRLKHLILTARLRPGSALFERDVAAELGVSRTPVREAIARLIAEGLVVRRARRGYLVTAMGAEQVSDLYAVREALETLAVRLATRRMGESACRRLEAAAEAASRPRGFREQRGVGRPGIRVHDLIVRHTGNLYLYESWRRVIEKALPYMWIETIYVDNAAQTLREHRRLCDYIRARKADDAEQLMRAHISRARDNLLRVLALQAGASPADDAVLSRVER